MSYKKKTREVILDYAKTHSCVDVINVAKAMLESKSFKWDKTFLSHTHGEVCESVLEVIIQDYIKKNPEKTKDWFYKKGLIIKDIKNPRSGYFTELDLTLFTPEMIYAFECKSYGGDKRITDKCMIRKKAGGTFDVFAQHYQHVKILSEQLDAFRIGKYKDLPAYQLVLFNFSTGKTEDIRDAKNKVMIPCLNEKNILNIFRLSSGKPKIWNMHHLEKAVSIITKKDNTEKHLKYVKELNKNRMVTKNDL